MDIVKNFTLRLSQTLRLALLNAAWNFVLMEEAQRL